MSDARKTQPFKRRNHLFKDTTQPGAESPAEQPTGQEADLWEAQGYIEFLDVQNNRLRKILSDVCAKAENGKPVDLALGTKAGSACIEIERMIIELFKEINARGDESSAEQPVVANVESDFLTFIRNEREAITKEMLSDEWWLTIPAAKRVKFENVLIAYDQMAERLTEATEQPVADNELKQEIDHLEKKISLCEDALEKLHSERYETRLALRMLLNVFKNDQISKEQEKYYSQAEAILNK